MREREIAPPFVAEHEVNVPSINTLLFTGTTAEIAPPFPFWAEHEVKDAWMDRVPLSGTIAPMAPPFGAEQEENEDPDSIVREEIESLEMAAPVPLVRETEETEIAREAVAPLPVREMSGRVD